MTTTQSGELIQLDSQLRSVWTRSQTLHLASGALAFCRWLIPLFLAALAVDWSIGLPLAIRGLLPVAAFIFCIRKSWTSGWNRLSRYDATRVALQLEESHGGLNSLLVSAVQLRQSHDSSGGSPELRAFTCRQANELATTLNPASTASFQPLQRPTTIAFLLAGVIGLLAIINGPLLTAGLQRIFTPWKTVEYPTSTRITFATEDLVVQQGASVEIEVTVAGVVPRECLLQLKTGEGEPRELTLDVIDDSCRYSIASASRDFTWQMVAGDARTNWTNVRVVTSPRIEQAQVRLEYPQYLGRDSETIEAMTLTAPEGTRVHWQLTLDRPVRSGTFLRDGELAEPMTVSEDGHQVSFNALVSDSRGYTLNWVDRDHSFKFSSSRYFLQVATDRTPQVEFTAPPGNLVAMLGRPLTLAVRARDDHGIDDSKIVYSLNQQPDQTVDFSPPKDDRQHPIDWDYRTALPELKVGDHLTITVEVSDRYPGENGPHTARSETRRISFLSREEYLEQIGRRRDQLLTRLRTIYRQERKAHSTVRNLDGFSASFIQSCQLEAIRQEMIRDQLKQTAAGMQALLDDLTANSVSDAPQGELLERLQESLIDIAESHVAESAELLRTQSGKQKDRNSGPAARAVNAAARDLGSLVLLGGIESAQEVYARETRMLAESQAEIRWLTADSSNESARQELMERQEELAQWTEQLLADLHAGMRYEKRPLAVLRLTRSIKELQNAGTGVELRRVGEFLKSGDIKQALARQASLTQRFLDAEFSVRLSGAYSTLLKTKDTLRSLSLEQTELREACVALRDDSSTTEVHKLADRQNELRRQLITLMLPSVPAPRARLSDSAPPTPPPVKRILSSTEAQMTLAVSHLNNGEQKQTESAQSQAESSLKELSAIVDQWSVETGLMTQGLDTLVADSSDRLSRIEDYEARVIALLEQMDTAVAEDKKVQSLAPAQSALRDDLGLFVEDLEELRQVEEGHDIPPVLRRLKQAHQALSAATEAMTNGESDRAIEAQEQAADAIADSFSIVTAQNERLSFLQDLLMFQRAVGFANRYMSDIVAEQREMLAATEAAKPDDVEKLLPGMSNLQKCMEEVAPLLDLVAGRLDVGTPLAFAQTDFEDAVEALRIGDTLEAIDAQDVAVESLAEVAVLVEDVRRQTGYVAEIVEFLHRSTSTAAGLQYRQEEVLARLPNTKTDQIDAVAAEQSALQSQITRYSSELTAAIGMPEYGEADTESQAIVSPLKAGETDLAAEQMELVALLLGENIESLTGIISVLHGLPQVEVTNQSPPELVQLVEVLAIASEHQTVYRKTGVAQPQQFESIAMEQQTLASRCSQIAEAGPPSPLLTQATEQLTELTATFESGDTAMIQQRQKLAAVILRRFIAEQAVLLDTSIKVSVSEGDADDAGEGSDSESDFSAGFISDFVSGETPADKRTDWKVLADRNRAALNQNFARELPLEYRGLLKNYYERLSK